MIFGDTPEGHHRVEYSRKVFFGHWFAVQLLELPRADLRVHLGGLQMLVTKEVRDLRQRKTVFEKMRRDTVTQVVQGHGTLEPGSLSDGLQYPMPTIVVKALSALVEHEGRSGVLFPVFLCFPGYGWFGLLVAFQITGYPYGHGREPASGSLAFTYVERVAVVVDVLPVEPCSFAPAQKRVRMPAAG